MTSELGRPATSIDARVDAVADRIAADWGHHGHVALAEMIAELYADLAVFPAHGTPQQHADAIADAADTTAGELATLLDDYIYQEADRPPVTQYGWVMHTDDRHQAVTATLASLTAGHLSWWLTDQLDDFIADREDEDAN